MHYFFGINVIKFLLTFYITFFTRRFILHASHPNQRTPYNSIVIHLSWSINFEMVRNRPTRVPCNASTPTPSMRRSICYHNGPVAGTPGERFCSLVLACSDFLPVADVITNLTAHADEVVVSSPPTK